MAATYSTHTVPLETLLFLQKLADFSQKATGWFLPKELSLSQGQVVLQETDSILINLSETGLGENQAIEAANEWKEALSYRPRTALGQRLWAIRARIIASGEPLLAPEEVEREVAERRGGYDR